MIATLTADGETVATLAVQVARRRTLVGHVRAADTARDGERLLHIADVIATGSCAEALRRYPGCAVAVSPSWAAARTGGMHVRGSDPLVSGLFLHAWLTAGYPAAPLTGLTIQETGRVARDGETSFCVIIEVL